MTSITLNGDMLHETDTKISLSYLVELFFSIWDNNNDEVMYTNYVDKPEKISIKPFLIYGEGDIYSVKEVRNYEPGLLEKITNSTESVGVMFQSDGFQETELIKKSPSKYKLGFMVYSDDEKTSENMYKKGKPLFAITKNFSVGLDTDPSTLTTKGESWSLTIYNALEGIQNQVISLTSSYVVFSDVLTLLDDCQILYDPMPFNGRECNRLNLTLSELVMQNSNILKYKIYTEPNSSESRSSAVNYIVEVYDKDNVKIGWTRFKESDYEYLMDNGNNSFTLMGVNDIVKHYLTHLGLKEIIN